MQRPTAQLPAPDYGTASHDQVSTTSTGGRESIFTPHRRSPTGEIQDYGTASHDQVSTTSTGGRGSIFTPHRRSPTGEIQDLGTDPPSRNREPQPGTPQYRARAPRLPSRQNVLRKRDDKGMGVRQAAAWALPRPIP